MRKNTIRIIYGPGNGKSASAVGYGLLGALAGKKVIIVQFLKGVLEEKSLETMNLRNGFNFAKKVMATGECDLLILDEVLGLVDQEVISREEFIRFLQSADDETDLIMTGRVCPDEIRQYADQISYVENL